MQPQLQIIGYVAAICTSISFLPQAIKVINTRDTAALSLTMYSVFSFGVCLWLVYGLILGDLPLILANAVTLTFALIILAMKIANRRKDKAIRARL